jgi:hypothetical protein
MPVQRRSRRRRGVEDPLLPQCAPCPANVAPLVGLALLDRDQQPGAFDRVYDKVRKALDHYTLHAVPLKMLEHGKCDALVLIPEASSRAGPDVAVYRP